MRCPISDETFLIKEKLTSMRDDLRETSQQRATSKDAGFISPMVTIQYGVIESLPAKVQVKR